MSPSMLAFCNIALRRANLVTGLTDLLLRAEDSVSFLYSRSGVLAGRDVLTASNGWWIAHLHKDGLRWGESMSLGAL